MPHSLEVIHRRPARKSEHPPLLFLHGAYAGAWIWDRHYLPWFAEQGWDAYACSLSGHGKSPGREQLNAFSLRDYVKDLARVIAAMPSPPIVIGHSMGGLVLQKYLEESGLPGAILLCSVPPQGILGSTFNLMFSHPHLLFDLNSIIGGGEPQIDTVRAALFHQPVCPQRLRDCFQHFQPESMRAIWDMSGFDLPRSARMQRPPMLILGTAHDTLIPPAQVEQTGRSLDLPVEILPDMGHALMLETDWLPGAQRIAAWLGNGDFS